MDNEAILGSVIMLLCCWGSAALFTGIAIRARKRNKPINFWAGKDVDPASVRDVAEYNRANSIMWLVYSLPYWISGGISLLFGRGDHMVILAAILLALACFPGIWILVRHYRKIETKYVIREKT